MKISTSSVPSCQSSLLRLSLILILSLTELDAFSFVSSTNKEWKHGTQSNLLPVPLSQSHSPLFLSQQPLTNNEPQPTPTLRENKLTHAMIRVPNVNETVSYWVNSRGATIKSQNPRTAFVGFGGFSLEITTLPPEETFDAGTAVRYFGLSMLLNFDLRTAAAGESGTGSRPLVDVDPNGWTVKSVAAAPGDSFSRLCLRAAGAALPMITQFYEALGMEEVAVDDKCVCLRFKGSEVEGKGVSVNLVFEKGDDDDGPLQLGNGFDHLAISTKSLDDMLVVLRSSDMESKIFMHPTEMFGTQLIGLTDPNGYKVFVYEEK